VFIARVLHGGAADRSGENCCVSEVWRRKISNR